MFYKELTESTQTIEDIYDTLSRDCSEFKSLSKNFKYVPTRQVGHIIDSYENFFTEDHIAKMNTLPTRESLAAISIVHQHSYTLLNDLIMDYGNASRIHHMASSSSTGNNPEFVYDEDRSLYLFPIGSFEYSYIPVDFNYHFNIRLFSDLFDVEKDVKSYDSLIDMIDIFEQELEELNANEEIDSKMYSEYGEYINEVKSELDKISSIKSDNYTSAFSDEHEIWFNVKSYYVVSTNTYKRLMELV